MIVLIGASGTGKSTVEKIFVEKGYNKIISYTTRVIRFGEINGVDYHFVSVEEFLLLDKNNMLVEKVCYDDNYYGIHKEDCLDNSVVVVEPNGFSQLQSVKGLNIKSLYIYADENIKAIRMLKRGNSLEEVYKRIILDRDVFSNNIDILAKSTFNINNNLDYDSLVKQVDFFIELYLMYR
jgi:guanylate kinase